MPFEESISKYIIGKVEISEIPKIAVKGVEEGYESESLFILAGMNENDNPFELKNYLELSLEELGIGPKSRFEAAKYLTDYYVNKIGQRVITPINGVDFIKNNCWDILQSKQGGKELDTYQKRIENIIHVWYNYFEDYVPSDITKRQYFSDIDNEIIAEIKKMNIEF